MPTITRMPRGRYALVVALAFAVIAACSPNDPGVADTVSVSNDDNASAAPGEETVDQVEDEGGDADEAEPQPAETADDPPTEPLATVEGQPPFATLEITDLRRVGDTVTLEFAMTSHESAAHESVLDLFAAPEDQRSSGDQPTDERRTSVSGVTVVDQVNRKRHLVLRDSEGNCLCTGFPEIILDGDARYPHSAQFPAPPEDVETMTVQVPSFPAIDNVPLRVAN